MTRWLIKGAGAYGTMEFRRSVHRQIAMTDMREELYLVQLEPRGLWALASSTDYNKDDQLFDLYGLMPFRVAVAKLRMLM